MRPGLNNDRFYLPLIFVISSIILVVSCKQRSAPGISSITTSSGDSLAIATLFSKARANKDSASLYKQQARALAKANGSVKCRAIYLALLGKDMIYSGQLDAADSIADKGIALPYSEEELSLKGRFYNIKGNVAGLKKKLYRSIEWYLKAEQVFEQAGDSAALAGIYSNVANSYFSLKDYPSANRSAGKAYALLHAVKESNIAANIITTYALSLSKVGRSAEALPIVRRADSLADATGNKMAKIASTIGLAEIFNADKQYDSALVYYNKTMLQGAELGIGHFELMGRTGLMAMYEAQGRQADVVGLSAPTIALANQLDNVDVLHTVKRIAGKALGGQRQYEEGFRLLNESYNLYDSVAGVENQKNINELLVKYDAEKKERELLAKDLLLTQQEAQLRSRQLIIVGLILGLSILFTVYFYARKLSRERLKRVQAEKEKKVGDAYIQGEQKERTRLAFEIHDGIAGMLTGISYKLRAADADKEEVIGLLTRLHEDTRRISHSLMPIDLEKNDLVDAVQDLCLRMTTTEIEVSFISKVTGLRLDERESLLLYRLVQELLNNAMKYAQCKTVFVNMDGDTGGLDITVEDDGIGIEKELIEKGFASIKERVRSLGATMSIDGNIGAGAMIKIHYSYA
jgi:two-component system NarL family sensor kinase